MPERGQGQNMLAMRPTIQWLQELGRCLVLDFVKSIRVQEHRAQVNGLHHSGMHMTVDNRWEEPLEGNEFRNLRTVRRDRLPGVAFFSHSFRGYQVPSYWANESS